MTLTREMPAPEISMFTVCGLEELTLHSNVAVTHVLSILDPEQPDPEAFADYGEHYRALLRFHDVIEPTPNAVLPERSHVEEILKFGDELVRAQPRNAHLLIHCHAGISRSTAAMAMMFAQMGASEPEHAIFERLVGMRPKAWPNSRMIGFADDLLGRGGRLTAALGPLYAAQLMRFPNISEYMRQNGRAREVEMAERA